MVKSTELEFELSFACTVAGEEGLRPAALGSLCGLLNIYRFTAHLFAGRVGEKGPNFAIFEETKDDSIAAHVAQILPHINTGGKWRFRGRGSHTRRRAHELPAEAARLYLHKVPLRFASKRAQATK